MGSIIQFGPPRKRRPGSRTGRDTDHSGGPRILHCHHCGEPHPVVRLAGGEERCVTAFWDGSLWFCRNRGCRRAWLEGGEAYPGMPRDPARGGGSRGSGRGKR